MKIGIDISQIVYSHTGVSSYTKNLIDELLKIDTTNHYVLFGSSLRRRKELLSSVSELPIGSHVKNKIFPLPPAFLRILWNQLHVLNIEHFVGSVDIFHTSDWIEPPASCFKVTTIHDLVAYKYPEYLDPEIVNTQRRRLHWIMHDQSYIIADSESTKNDILEILHIPVNRIYVVHLGVSSSFFQLPANSQGILDKYFVKGKYILTVGTREPRKNLARVIEAYKQIKESDIELLVVGKYGWGRDIELVPGVRILDSVNDEDLATIYRNARCFVYPSLYEGFGLPVLEAFASGCPVVTSNRGSLAEIAGPAILVDPQKSNEIAESIDFILSLSSVKRQELESVGKQHAAKFTWEKTARETLKVYTEIYENRN